MEGKHTENCRGEACELERILILIGGEAGAPQEPLSSQTRHVEGGNHRTGCLKDLPKGLSVHCGGFGQVLSS